jgi:hypothetical protein
MEKKMEAAKSAPTEIVRDDTVGIVRPHTAEPSPFTLAKKSLGEAVVELQGLLNSRYAGVNDIREGLERVEGAEMKFRPRYFGTVKRLSLPENQEAVELLESSREVSFRAMKRVGLTAK